MDWIQRFFKILKQKRFAMQQTIPENSIVTPLQQTNIAEMRQGFILSLHESFDTCGLSKKVQFEIIQLLRRLLDAQPDLIKDPLIDQYVAVCTNLVIAKYPQQPKVVEQASSPMLSSISETILQKVQQSFDEIQNPEQGTNPNPYELLDKLKEQSMMEMKYLKMACSLLDFSITFEQAYSSSTYDLLFAIISFLPSQISSVQKCLALLENSVSPNALNLKLFIENVYQSLKPELNK